MGSNDEKIAAGVAAGMCISGPIIAAILILEPIAVLASFHEEPSLLVMLAMPTFVLVVLFFIAVLLICPKSEGDRAREDPAAMVLVMKEKLRGLPGLLVLLVVVLVYAPFVLFHFERKYTLSHAPLVLLVLAILAVVLLYAAALALGAHQAQQEATFGTRDEETAAVGRKGCVMLSGFHCLVFTLVFLLVFEPFAIYLYFH